MITLYTFGPMLELPDVSPFVVKAELLLKMAGLPYRTERADLRKAPKGKLPYIDDEGTVVADSTLIRWHLEARHGIDFDRVLPARDRALAWSVQKMLEEHLYWALVHARWMDDANFARGPARFFDDAPALIRPAIRATVRRKVKAALRAQGFGRHARPEIEALGIRSIQALAGVLGGTPYLFGAEPCGADAMAFAFVSGALCPAFDTPLRDAAEACPNLVAYEQRLRGRYYPDLAPAVAA